VTRIHVLSRGFQTPNGRAFLFPLTVWRRALAEYGLDCRIFHTPSPALTDCDALLVDSKFHRDRWSNDKPAVLAEFSEWAARCRVIYCDTTDSSGWLQPDLLPIVHRYAKAQMLRDRGGYLKPLYGHSSYAEYYHVKFNVDDSQPEWSSPVVDPKLLDKLCVSWNSGLADYSLYGPARMALYDWLPAASLLRFPDAIASPSSARPRDVSARFGTAYARASVAAQRRLIKDKLATYHLDTAKLSRRAYFAELQASKVVVSPFGYGEITLKDFEVLLTGGLLLKPDMSHMETWPDLFRADETMLAHRWDLSDLSEVLERALGDPSRLGALAEAGQKVYRAHTSTPGAAVLFADHLRSIVTAPR